MEKSIVLKLYRFCVVLTFCGLLAGIAGAETLHLSAGQTVSGEIVSIDDKGIVLKQPDGSYGERIAWTKLSQADLKELQQNPKAAPFVEPFIEVSQADKLAKTEIQLKEVERMPRPTGHSLIAAMFTSAIGIFTLFLLYAGNMYAAYEISVFRAQPVGLVCGVAAVAPVLGPIIFLAMPTRLKQKEAEWQPPAEEPVEAGIATAIAAEQAAAANAEAAAAQSAAPALPPTKTFMRGQYTFNRRFFETQMPGYFAMTRPDADKDMVLTVKSTRGTHVAQRFSRISGNELYVQVMKGNAFEDVIIPFVEIQEVQIKHKDA